MRTILLATSDIACPLIRVALTGGISGLEPVALITMPPRPAGRKLNLTPTPVQCTFDDIHPDMPIFTPEKLVKNTDILEQLAALNPEALLAFSTGFYIPKALVKMTPYPMCVHPSPLPMLRGANPVRSALYLGWSHTAIALMRIEPKMDTGNVFATINIDIPEACNYDLLNTMISRQSISMVKNAWPKLVAGELGVGLSQDHHMATYARRLKAADYRLDWNRSASELYYQVRALAYKPGAKTIFRDKELKVLSAKHYPEFNGIAGKIVTRHPETCSKGVFVYCQTGLLELLEVQPGGKNLCAAKALIANWSIREGDSFDFPPEPHQPWVASYAE